MDDLATKLNIRNQDDWYTISWKTLQLQGAGSLLTKYNGSPSKILTTIYPEYPQAMCLLFHRVYVHVGSLKIGLSCRGWILE